MAKQLTYTVKIIRIENIMECCRKANDHHDGHTKQQEKNNNGYRIIYINRTLIALRIGWTSFGLMRKHVSTTRLIYLAVVLQDASKSYVAFLLLCTIV